MATNYIAPTWRMPENTNQSKLSNYSIDLGVTSSKYVNVGEGFNFTNGSNDLPFSISCWAYMRSVNSFRFVGKRGPTSAVAGYQWITYTSGSGVLSMIIYDSQQVAYKRVKTNSSISSLANQWVHIVFTYDGNPSTGKKIYINGAAPTMGTTQDSSGNYQRMRQNTSSVLIGSNNIPGDVSNGIMSQVCIFDYEISSDQVNYLYNLNNPMAITGTKPTGYWPIGDNSNTTSLAGYPNIATSGYSSYSFKSPGGANDLIGLSNASSPIMNGQSTLSISAWFKLSTLVTNSSIFGNWYSGNAKYLVRFHATLGMQWYIFTGGVTVKIDTGFFPALDTWTHVIGVKDQSLGQMRIYINGVQANNSPVSKTGSLSTTSSEDQIAGYNNANPLSGSISNVAYWPGTAITDSQALSLYNGGTTQDLNSFTPTPSNWLPLDETSLYYDGSEVRVRDIVGKAIVGTAINSSEYNIFGNAPGSTANGIGVNLSINDLKGNMSNSIKNSYSINMADYGDPNSQGVTPANSGRTTDVPGN